MAGVRDFQGLCAYMGISQYWCPDAAVLADFSTNFKWFTDGLAVVGRALPAVGFALLLSYMDIKKYWPFMIVGYVLFAYMSVPTIGLALVGAAAGFLYTTKKGGAQ